CHGGGRNVARTVTGGLAADSLPAASTATTVYACQVPGATSSVREVAVVSPTTVAPSYTRYRATGWAPAEADQASVIRVPRVPPGVLPVTVRVAGASGRADGPAAVVTVAAALRAVSPQGCG